MGARKDSFKIENDISTTSHESEELSDVFCTFCQTTSMHGARYIGDRNIFTLNRFFWLSLLCFSTGMLVYQITDRVIYYYDWPIIVNVKVNYNTSLSFPAVTICNQNTFKATLAAKHNWYPVLQKLFSKDQSVNDTDLDKYNLTDVKLDYLYQQTANKKEDFILSCTWKGRKCDLNNFKQVITDHGVCYTFKTFPNESSVSSGLENGLKLTLNVEQYEYMPGPHDAVGIKFLLHSPGEFPLVHSLGQAIPTGSHVFVGVKLNEITNLPHPHGNCVSNLVHYIDVYNSAACRFDCQSQVAENSCQCRNAHMVTNKGLQNVCTLKEYKNCLRPETERVSNLHQLDCYCPISCFLKVFNIDTSYSRNSQYSMNDLLQDKNVSSLKESVRLAMEISTRFDKFKHIKTSRLIDNLRMEYFYIKSIMIESLNNSVTNLWNNIQSEYQHEHNIYLFRERLYRYQIYNVKKNLERVRDAMEERTFSAVALSYSEFGLQVKNKMMNIVNESNLRIKKQTYLSALEVLQNRKQLVVMAMINYSQLYEAYKSGKKIYNYQFEDIPRSHNDISFPVQLVTSSLEHNSYATIYGSLFGVRLDEAIMILNDLEGKVNEAYNNKTFAMDTLENITEHFYWVVREFLFAKSVFYREIVEWPARVLEKDLCIFNKIWKKTNHFMKVILQNIRILSSKLKYTISTLEQINIAVIQNLYFYLTDANYSKYDLASILSSKTVLEYFAEVKNFFVEMRLRENIILDILTIVPQRKIEFWTKILQDRDSSIYYDFINRTDLTRNLTIVINELKANFTKYHNLSQFSHLITKHKYEFSKAFVKVSDDFVSFRNSIKIDDTFLRENIVKLDIFYKQMSYQQINQQEAYDAFSLLCDIGGSMGLFLGASVLSIFELLDILIYKAFVKTKDKCLMKN